MPTEHNEQDVDNITLIKLIVKNYGSYAFSLIYLIVLWFLIINPLISLFKVNYDTQREITQQMKEITVSMERTATKLEDIADGKRD